MEYGKYGRSNQCRNGKGGPWANDVYSITGRSLKVSLQPFSLTLKELGHGILKFLFTYKITFKWKET